MDLIQNLINNYNFLQQDYIGFNFNFFNLFNNLISLAVSISIVLILYLFGLRITQFFFKQESRILSVFLGISIGYIFSASILLILGILQMLHKPVLYLYYFLLLAIAIYPLKTLTKRLTGFQVVISNYLKQFSVYKLVNIAILGFLLISFLRLIPPEIGVDAIWYHTDYPRMYLDSNSMMEVDPEGKYYPAVTPTLSDMLYVVTESLGIRDSSRFLHFGFYLLVVMEFLILFRHRFPFVPYAVLLFVTSPVIIRHSSSAYAEFPWISCWLLSVLLITSKNKHNLKNIILPAVLLGGALATKLWILPFFGVFLLYLTAVSISESKIKLLKILLVFTITTLSIPFLWYLRAYLITGNPLFPTFWNYPDGSANTPLNFFISWDGLKTRVLGFLNVSPLSIIGFLSLIFFWKNFQLKQIKKNKFVIFVIILTLIQVLINYSYHRFIIPFYSIFSIILAIGLQKFINFNKYLKYTFYLLTGFIFFYYFLNTLLILPYGLGWANKNKYLTRILSRDNSSYYDYNYQFSKFIKNNENVATYGLWGFYYADFKHVYAEDIFKKEERSLFALKKRNLNKLLILGKDIEKLCNTEKLTDCTKKNFILLTSYRLQDSSFSQYLYQLQNHAK